MRRSIQGPMVGLGLSPFAAHVLVKPTSDRWVCAPHEAKLMASAVQTRSAATRSLGRLSGNRRKQN